MRLQAGQLRVGLSPQVDRHRLGRSVLDPEKSSVAPIPLRVVSAVASGVVLPIGKVEGAIGTVIDVGADVPMVIGEEEIRPTIPDVGGASRFHVIPVHAMPVEIVHQKSAPILRRKAVPLINRQPTVGVTAAGEEGVSAQHIGMSVLARPPMRVFGDVPGVVEVLGDRCGQLVQIRVGVLAGLPLVVVPRDDVPQVRNHAGRGEPFSRGIEIEAPRVRGPTGKDLEAVPDRMIAPHPGVEKDPLRVRRPGLPNVRFGKNAVTAVKPAVRAPLERVQGLVGVLGAPTIE